jgi:hypothetical protein
MDDLEDGANCTQCGTLTITDPKGICYDCWAENDLSDHESELAKKNSIDLPESSIGDTEE